MQTFYKHRKILRNFICGKLLSGPLRNHIQGYFQFRYNRGYMDTQPILSTLKNFDTFLKGKGIELVKEINQLIVLEWFTKQHYYYPQGKRQRLSHLNIFFKYLQRIGIIRNNPISGIIIKGSKHQPYIYSLKEICNILSEAKKLSENSSAVYQGTFFYTLFYLIYAMGLRLNEALSIRLKDVSLNEKTIFVYKGKFGKERLLPFSKNTVLKLKEFLKVRLKIYPPLNNEEMLFCNKYHQKYSKLYVEQVFRKFTQNCLLVKPGENLPRIHDLRHSFATHYLYKLYNEKKDVLNKLPLLSTYMGHVDISSTQVYLTISAALLKEANKRFEEKFSKK